MQISKKFKLLILSLILLIPTITNAATSSDIHFCEYPGTLRTFMIIGIGLNIIKTVIPLIIIGGGIITFSKIVISGKEDELKASVGTLIKKIVAGLVVFLLPTAINYAFNTLITNDTSKFTECSTCLLDTDHCNIPEQDPTTYQED